MLWELPSVLLFPSFPGGYWTSDKKIPACTLPEALTYLLDITTPPSQQLLRKLSQLVTAEGDKQRLEVLCQVSVRARFMLEVLYTELSDALLLCSRNLRNFCSDGAWFLSLCYMLKPTTVREGVVLWLNLGVGIKRLLQSWCFLCGSGWVILPACFSCLPHGGFWWYTIKRPYSLQVEGLEGSW